MDEMLLTWRTGAPNGKELFGLAPQMAIERGIWGEQAVSSLFLIPRANYQSSLAT